MISWLRIISASTALWAVLFALLGKAVHNEMLQNISVVVIAGSMGLVVNTLIPLVITQSQNKFEHLYFSVNSFLVGTASLLFYSKVRDQGFIYLGAGMIVSGILWIRTHHHVCSEEKTPTL